MVSPPFAQNIIMSSLDSLKRQRTSLKARLTKFQKYLDDLGDSADLILLQIKLDAVSKHFEKFYETHEELIEADDAKHQDSHQAELESMEESFYLLCSRVRARIQHTQEAQTEGSSNIRRSSPNPSSLSISSSSRLPEIRIPRFDGSLEDWRPFRDMFVSKIHADEKISSVDKLYYLRSHVTGKAARAIEAIECTSENYEAAWKILNDKYDNSRKAILRHWSILHDIPRLSRDSPSALEELTDTFRQHTRALKSLGEPTEHFNSILIFLLSSKITEAIRFQWETTLPNNKMPKVESLLDFLTKRGSCSEFSSRNTTIDREKPKQSNSQKGKSFMVKSNRKFDPCYICQQNHPVYRCEKFHSMSVSQRIQAVLKIRACMNCLRRGHTPETCSNGPCRACGSRHNTLVHQGKPDKQDQAGKQSTSGVSGAEIHRADSCL